jgi:hypothetical protein
MRSMLDKYLPRYHFSETHKILINAKPERIWRAAEEMDMSGSKVIRFLFWLRGMPKDSLKTKGLDWKIFTELERHKNDEFIVGLIGQFWKPNGNLQRFKPEEFTSFSNAGFAKGVMNFQLRSENKDQTWVVTTTRVQINDRKPRFLFSCYWFFVRPFSGLIRREMLKAIKNKCVL